MHKNISKLRLTRKGRLRKCISQGIPVLSIFALLGIISYSLNSSSDNTSMAYAEESVATQADTSASLTIDDNKIKDTILASPNEFTYATHKVAVSANNIKSYTLKLSGPTSLTPPSGGTSPAGAGGKTPTNMNNQWGYAWIAENADPTTATYKTVTTNENLADISIDSSHNLNATKQLAFGAKFGADAAAGHYTAEVTLSLVATPRVVTNYKVNVNCNSGTNCTSALNTSSDMESYTYTISTTTPTRSGYKFLGYNTTNTTTANATYAPGKTVTLTAINPTLNLYAIWQLDIPTVSGFGGIQKMQDMTTDICKGVSANTTGELYDTRDNNIYTVAKLSDNNCWMTQNMKIELNVVDKLTSENSDVTVNFPASDSQVVISNDLTIWKNQDAAALVYSTNPSVIRETTSPQNPSGEYQSSYGYYYSWCAATAGSCVNKNKDGDEAPYSICPKGWRLPTGYTGSQDFNKLKTYSQTTLNGMVGQNFGGAFWLFSGSITKEGLTYATYLGDYWARTSRAGNQADSLNIRNSQYSTNGVNFPNWASEKYEGLPVRCVAYSS